MIKSQSRYRDEESESDQFPVADDVDVERLGSFIQHAEYKATALFTCRNIDAYSCLEKRLVYLFIVAFIRLDLQFQVGGLNRCKICGIKADRQKRDVTFLVILNFQPYWLHTTAIKLRTKNHFTLSCAGYTGCNPDAIFFLGLSTFQVIAPKFRGRWW